MEPTWPRRKQQKKTLSFENTRRRHQSVSQSVSQQLSPTTAHGRRTSGTPRGAPIRLACPGPPPVRLLLHRTAARGVVVVPSRSACPFQRRCGYLSLCPWPLPAPRDRPPGPEPRRESRVAPAPPPPSEIPSRRDWNEGDRRRRLRRTPPRRMRRRPADSGARRRLV
jgi:hypothetical protein